MNREQVVALARQVWGQTAILPTEDLERFAALVAAHEAEECAKLCDGISAIYKHPDEKAARFVSDWCATTIRSRT